MPANLYTPLERPKTTPQLRSHTDAPKKHFLGPHDNQHKESHEKDVTVCAYKNLEVPINLLC